MKYLLIFLSVLFLIACGNKYKQVKKEVAPGSKSIQVSKSAELYTQARKDEFQAENYWTNFNFRNTQQAEQLFITFIDLLSKVPLYTSLEGLNNMMDKAEADSLMFSCFVSLSEKYLYNPNSPKRNETMYIVVLERILASAKFDKVYKIRYRHQYNLAMKNRPGKEATDFRYTLINGKKGTMHAIKANYLLLFFNNPDCGDCKRVKQQISISPLMRSLQQSGALKILSLYPDKELRIWYENYSLVPDTWINAYDKGALIEAKELYDLKAIPTLYLLDKEKRVLLKDAGFEEIEHFLQTNGIR